jgi:hypothetical protein
MTNYPLAVRQWWVRMINRATHLPGLQHQLADTRVEHVFPTGRQISAHTIA